MEGDLRSYELPGIPCWVLRCGTWAHRVKEEFCGLYWQCARRVIQYRWTDQL